MVALIFLAPFVGYLLAALLNNLIHHHLGQLGVAFLGPLCRMIGYIPMALHPPYPALPVFALFPGFGNGIEDSAWNAWVGNMENANELLGFLHGAYGLGATIGPLIATAMVTKANPPLPWYSFYYFMIGMAALNGALIVTAFWGASGAVHRATHASTTGEKRTTTRHVLRDPITWMVALFLLVRLIPFKIRNIGLLTIYVPQGYVGAEVSLGGWIVTFQLDGKQRRLGLLDTLH